MKDKDTTIFDVFLCLFFAVQLLLNVVVVKTPVSIIGGDMTTAKVIRIDSNYVVYEYESKQDTRIIDSAKVSNNMYQNLEVGSERLIFYKSKRKNRYKSLFCKNAFASKYGAALEFVLPCEEEQSIRSVLNKECKTLNFKKNEPGPL